MNRFSIATAGTWVVAFAGLCLAGASGVRAQNGRVAIEFFTCEADDDTVALSWRIPDLEDADPEEFGLRLFRSGVPLADLSPSEADFVDEEVPTDVYQYRLDVVRLDGAKDPLVARALCQVSIAGVRCEVFGGVATPPVLVIHWILPRPDPEEILIFKDDELRATVPGNRDTYEEEPEGGPAYELRVVAIYPGESVTVGSCIVDWRPPVIGGLQRGDCTGDGNHDLSDAVCILSFLFLGGTVGCEQTADVDDNSVIELSDPIFLLNHFFLGGPPPAPPYPECGHDNTSDSLTCLEHFPCFNPPPP